jgi:hypothetical protein
MTQFFWQLDALKSHPEFDGKKDVVHTITWKCRAIDAPFEASYVGDVPVPYDASAEFTPSPAIEESRFWSWIEHGLNKAAVETALQTNIDNQKSANNTNKPLTWSN